MKSKLRVISRRKMSQLPHGFAAYVGIAMFLLLRFETSSLARFGMFDLWRCRGFIPSLILKRGV